MKKYRTIVMGLAALVVTSGQSAIAESRIDAAEKVIKEIKAKYAPDKRQIIYNVTARQGVGTDVVIDGEISEGWILDSLEHELSSRGIKLTNSVYVYPDDKWALTRLSVAPMRSGRSHAAEMATQSIMGMPIRILSEENDWYLAQTPDGYISWIPSSSVVIKSEAEMKSWRESPRYVVTSPYQVRAYISPKATGAREVVTDLVTGNIVRPTGNREKSGRVEIELPDGRLCWVEKSAVTPIEVWAAQDFNPDVILDQAYSMEGTPYLWGGASIKTLDCSGLAKVSYLANGIILMRDASQQALTGTRIEAEDWRTCEPGDLLFFGNIKTGRVTHVAVYDHDGNYVHSSGRVRRNSVDPSSEIYERSDFLHAVRIHGNEGTNGITYARNHTWYFNQQ